MLVILHVPAPLTTAEPNTLVPSLSYKVIVAPTSPVPVTVGVSILVKSSVLEVPLSELANKSGFEGVVTPVSNVYGCVVIAEPPEAVVQNCKLCVPDNKVTSTKKLPEPASSV